MHQRQLAITATNRQLQLHSKLGADASSERLRDVHQQVTANYRETSPLCQRRGICQGCLFFSPLNHAIVAVICVFFEPRRSLQTLILHSMRWLCASQSNLTGTICGGEDFIKYKSF